MSIRYKLLLPSLLLFLILGGAAYWFVNHQLDTMLYESAEKIILNKEQEILLGTNTLSKKALETAGIFSRLPEVVAAFTVALEGDLDNEDDPKAQQAREMLRASLAPALEGVKAATGGTLKLHFHLPNGRSLVRLWREKQALRRGQWVDVSDDLSDFRTTVLEVNRTGKPVSGLELGRGGFVLRGLAPVVAPDGRQLGSVEVLTDFNKMLGGKSKQQEENLLLFMNADLLPITTSLQDKDKYPVLPGGFVRLFDSSEGQASQLFSQEALEQGAKGVHRETHGDTVLATFPLTDYRGEQVGVIGFTRDLSSEQSYVRMVSATLAGLMLLVMASFIAVSFYVLVRTVFRPVTAVVRTITDITEDKADLGNRLDYQANDEIGELCRRFNTLMDKIVTLVNLSQNVLDAIPDPVFAMDRNFNIILANEAVASLAGTSIEGVKGRKCADVFKTTVCGTELCPVQQVMTDPSRARGDFDFVHSRLDAPGQEGKEGQDWYIHPHVAEIRDHGGNVTGYVELVKDVTQHVQSEEAIKHNLENVQNINVRLQETAERIVTMADSVSDQAHQVRQGADTQRHRMAETATAMESMNQSIMDVASNASEAASHNQLTRDRASEGAEVVQRSISSIGKVHEQTQSLKNSLAELAEQTQAIGAIMSVISDIADQTNLLALNAAIEAARAGESGRGFAVVADEVRKLAEKTMGATKEVGQAIASIQQHSKVNIQNMDEAARTVDEAMHLADASGAALREIVELVGRASDQVSAIAAAAEQQSAASEEIAASVEEVSRISEETAQGMESQVRTLGDLASLTQELRSLAEES